MILADRLNRLFKSAFVPVYLAPDALVFWTNGIPRCAKVLIQDDGRVRLERDTGSAKDRWETIYLAAGDPELSDKLVEWVSNHLTLD